MLNDLERSKSRSLRVRCDSAIGLLIHDFLLMFNSNIWSSYGPKENIRLQNVSNLEFGLSGTLKVKCDDVIWTLHICFPINV